MHSQTLVHFKKNITSKFLLTYQGQIKCQLWFTFTNFIIFYYFYFKISLTERNTVQLDNSTPKQVELKHVITPPNQHLEDVGMTHGPSGEMPLIDTLLKH